MEYAVIVSAVVLGLSVLATAAKFIDWFLHSDPQTMVRTIRWMLLLLVLTGIPLLVVMIVREQWAGAMLLGAAMTAIPLFIRWDAISGPLRAAFGRLRSKPASFKMPPVWDGGEDRAPTSVREAAAILEAYVAQRGRSIPALAGRDTDTGGDRDDDEARNSMEVSEALKILGVEDGADLVAVHAAHRKLMRGVDLATGGSPYLAARLDEARDVLVVALALRKGPSAVRDSTPRRLTNR